MEELVRIWDSIPNIIKTPALVILAWAIIVKVLVGITSGGTELTEDESTRAFGIFISPLVGCWIVLWGTAKAINRAAHVMKYPGAVDEDDIELL